MHQPSILLAPTVVSLNGDACLAADLLNGCPFFRLAKYESNLAVGELGIFHRKILLMGYANLYENFPTLCGLVFGKQVNGSIVEMVICRSACQKIAKEKIAFNNQDTIN